MADTLSQGKRITLKHDQPNPLLQRWLEELYEEAKKKQSKLEGMLKEALTSISKYPLPLNSGAECAILKGFDRRLCTFIDKRLEVYNSQRTHKTESNIDNKCDDIGSNKEQSLTISKQISPKKGQAYRPAYRSGGYAILITLLSSQEASMKKEKIVELAQEHSDESFVRPKPGTFYTAWSNMTRLVNKGLVKKVGRKNAEYSLTDKARKLAVELLEESKNIPTANDIIFNGRQQSSDVQPEPVSLSNRNNEENEMMVEDNSNFFELTAGTFDIILLIDKNETGGVTKKNDPTVAQFKKYPDLKHEYRSLKVGDYAWIAQSKHNNDHELVLPFIVERKRMDDLGASIKDGRFHEQKFRLKKSGLKNIIYLIENYGSNKHVGLPIQSLMQALANTRVQDGFKIHTTDSLSATARFLAMLTKRLTFEYKDKNLKGSDSDPTDDTMMTYSYFNKTLSKTKPLTVTQTFIKLLLRLKGVSVEKALAITEVYRTPSSLIKAYDSCNKKEGESLLESLSVKNGIGTRCVGPTVSKAVYHLFSTMAED